MRYVQMGRVPRKRHVQFRDPGHAAGNGNAPLLVEEVLGLRGLLGQRVDPLPPAVALPGEGGRRVHADRARGVGAGHARAPAHEHARARAGGRQRARPARARVQRRRRDRDLPARARGRLLLPRRRGRRGHLRPRGRGRRRDDLRRAAVPPVGLRRDPARHDVPLPLRHAAALAHVLHAGRDRDAEPLPQPLRAAARARAVLPARLPAAARAASPTATAASSTLKVRVRGGYQDYVLDYHPFDVVGWDGYVYPYTFNILDFEPKAGRLHQPPPAHQTFQGPNFVICSFCPRMLDWDDEAIVLPVPPLQRAVRGGHVLRRRPLRRAQGRRRRLHHAAPSGLPHGPQPGLVEKSARRQGDERSSR